MREGGLDRDWAMGFLIDGLDAIGRHAHPGKAAKAMEGADKQMRIYQALGIAPPKAR